MKQRLFVAINLSTATKLALLKISSQLPTSPALRTAKADNLHLTLQFLGDIEIDSIPAIRDVLTLVANQHHPFELACTRLGAFPNFNQPQTIWIGVMGPRLMELQTDLTKSLRKLVPTLDTKPFKPHLTLARVKAPLSTKDLATLQSLTTKIILPPPTSVTSIDLMASTLTPRGPIHNLVSHHPFLNG
ncbi:MAG: RNA 2',3'-cyclic phosphodiesterase [Patescibacteria group bacterium]